MHVQIVFQGLPEQIAPILHWCNDAGVSYYLTHLIVGKGDAVPDADETLYVQRFWTKTGEAIVHTWEQPEEPDQFRGFKQMTYSMNQAALARCRRDLLQPSVYDAIVYFNGYSPGSLPTKNPFENLTPLDNNIVLAQKNDSLGEVSHHFFITRPHNFDRISLLWKRRNNPIYKITPVKSNGRTAWWKWLRLLDIKVHDL